LQKDSFDRSHTVLQSRVSRFPARKYASDPSPLRHGIGDEFTCAHPPRKDTEIRKCCVVYLSDSRDRLIYAAYRVISMEAWCHKVTESMLVPDINRGIEDEKQASRSLYRFSLRASLSVFDTNPPASGSNL